jgi:hypothetical protein
MMTVDPFPETVLTTLASSVNIYIYYYPILILWSFRCYMFKFKLQNLDYHMHFILDPPEKMAEV